jgi:hypothetical protein
MQGLLLVPFGELAAAEDEAEGLALRKLRHELLLEGFCGGEGKVNLYFPVRLEIGELVRPPADGPARCQRKNSIIQESSPGQG